MLNTIGSAFPVLSALLRGPIKNFMFYAQQRSARMGSYPDKPSCKESQSRIRAMHQIQVQNVDQVTNPVRLQRKS